MSVVDYNAQIEKKSSRLLEVFQDLLALIGEEKKNVIHSNN